MAKLHLLLANANHVFLDSEINLITGAVEDAQTYLTKELGLDYDIDILITPPSQILRTVPEDGITGRTYSSRFIIIVLNKDEAPITRESIFETICHEMSHSFRWEMLPEHAATLFEGMMMEGLAVVLEEKALMDNRIATKQFFLKTIQDTSPEEIDAMISKLKDNFNDTEYDYETLFFTGNKNLPRWTGYRLGYYFVKKYLRENPNVALSEATIASYKNFSY